MLVLSVQSREQETLSLPVWMGLRKIIIIKKERAEKEKGTKSNYLPRIAERISSKATRKKTRSPGDRPHDLLQYQPGLTESNAYSLLLSQLLRGLWRAELQIKNSSFATDFAIFLKAVYTYIHTLHRKWAAKREASIQSCWTTCTSGFAADGHGRSERALKHLFTRHRAAASLLPIAIPLQGVPSHADPR